MPVRRGMVTSEAHTTQRKPEPLDGACAAQLCAAGRLAGSYPRTMTTSADTLMRSGVAWSENKGRRSSVTVVARRLPDADRDSQAITCRRLASTAEAALAARASWWEAWGEHPNMKCADSPQQLREALLHGAGPIFVDFFAAACNACRRLHPKLMQIASQNPDVTFLKVRRRCVALLLWTLCAAAQRHAFSQATACSAPSQLIYAGERGTRRNAGPVQRHRRGSATVIPAVQRWRAGQQLLGQLEPRGQNQGGAGQAAGQGECDVARSQPGPLAGSRPSTGRSSQPVVSTQLCSSSQVLGNFAASRASISAAVHLQSSLDSLSSRALLLC